MHRQLHHPPVKSIVTRLSSIRGSGPAQAQVFSPYLSVFLAAILSGISSNTSGLGSESAVTVELSNCAHYGAALRVTKVDQRGLQTGDMNRLASCDKARAAEDKHGSAAAFVDAIVQQVLAHVALPESRH
jgi:hypothetical protein